MSFWTRARLQVVKDELFNDPDGRRYKTADAHQCFAEINRARAGIVIEREIVERHEILGAIDPAADATLTAVGRRELDGITEAGGVDMKSRSVRNSFDTLFPASGVTARTNAALVALRTYEGSQAEKVIGTNCPLNRVGDALRL